MLRLKRARTEEVRMYIDTANIKQIEKAIKTGIIKGVTTNPTILLKEKSPRDQQLKYIYAWAYYYFRSSCRSRL